LYKKKKEVAQFETGGCKTSEATQEKYSPSARRSAFSAPEILNDEE
jgi:hypothetical protein